LLARKGSWRMPDENPLIENGLQHFRRRDSFPQRGPVVTVWIGASESLTHEQAVALDSAGLCTIHHTNGQDLAWLTDDGERRRDLAGPRLKTTRVIVPDIKEPDAWSEMLAELGVPAHVRDRFLQFGEYASLELEVNEKLEIVSARFIPLDGVGGENA
jgi:hypothetical protein